MKQSECWLEIYLQALREKHSVFRWRVYKTHVLTEHQMQGQDNSFESNMGVELQVELHISSAEMTLLFLVLLFQNKEQM